MLERLCSEVLPGLANVLILRPESSWRLESKLLLLRRVSLYVVVTSMKEKVRRAFCVIRNIPFLLRQQFSTPHSSHGPVLPNLLEFPNNKQPPFQPRMLLPTKYLANTPRLFRFNGGGFKI